jgi:hypothetical protein
MENIIYLENNVKYRMTLSELYAERNETEKAFINKLTINQYERFVDALKTSEGVIIERITKSKKIIELYELRQELNRKIRIIEGKEKQQNILSGGLRIVA